MNNVTRFAALGFAVALVGATAACSNGMHNQAEGTARSQQGQMEQAVGNATGNTSLQDQGLSDKAAGHAQAAWGNTQQGASNAWEATKAGAADAYQSTKHTINRATQ